MNTRYLSIIMIIENEVKLDFKDVLIKPRRSNLNSRSEVCLERKIVVKSLNNADLVEWNGVPICASNMDTTGTFSMAKVLYKERCLTAIHKHYSIDDWVNFSNSVISTDIFDYVVLSLGTSDMDFSKTKTIVERVPHVRMLMIDIANGYSAHFLERIKEIRESFPDKILFAGNVVTAEMTEDLILNGVNIVKVGLGSGSACKTRTQTGVGYPQLSATIECAEAAHRVGGYIMSDGGITCPGDAAKAFAAGADFIMLGGLLSGHDESEFPIVEKDGKKYIEFYGMSSRKAMNKYHGGLASYRSSEGREVLLPYRGAVMNTLMDMLGGIRSSCTYIGAKYLTEMSTFTTFIRVTQQINKIWGD